MKENRQIKIKYKVEIRMTIIKYKESRDSSTKTRTQESH